jgi:TonB family protein
MRQTHRGLALAAALALAAPLALTTAAAGGEKLARWEKGCGLSEPKVVEKAAPAYPEDARNEKVQGVVVLEVTITAEGSVTDIETIEDPDARLTAAARDAVARWRFEPARDEKGKAAAVRYRLTVAFKLQ